MNIAAHDQPLLVAEGLVEMVRPAARLPRRLADAP